MNGAQSATATLTLRKQTSSAKLWATVEPVAYKSGHAMAGEMEKFITLASGKKLSDYKTLRGICVIVGAYVFLIQMQRRRKLPGRL